MKWVFAALLAVAITSPAAADIDASQADARLIGMTIYIGGLMGFWPRSVWIPLNWANKEEDYIRLLMTNAQVAAFLGPGLGIGSR
jgi:hypothetical protein